MYFEINRRDFETEYSSSNKDYHENRFIEGYKEKFIELLFRYARHEIKMISFVLEYVDGKRALSDKEFYSMVDYLYEFEYEEEDVLQFISKKMGKNYRNFRDIFTTMVDGYTADENCCEGFEQDKQLYHVSLLAAISENIEIDFNHKYSAIEIQKMLDNKDILIMEYMYEKVDEFFEKIDKNNSEKIVYYPIFDLGKIFEFVRGDYDNFEEEDFYLLVSILRNGLSKNKIYGDLLDFVVGFIGGFDYCEVGFEFQGDLNYKKHYDEIIVPLKNEIYRRINVIEKENQKYKRVSAKRKVIRKKN